MLLVVDTRGWAFSHVAQYIQQNVKGYHFDILYTEDYKTHPSFLKAVRQCGPEILFFFSRTFLFNLINYLSVYSRQYRELLTNRCILTTIPDHALSHSRQLKHYSRYFELTDGYITINEHLFKTYTDSPIVKSPYGVIHDHPVLLLEPIPRSTVKDSSVPLNVIWVGNSRWGKTYGYKDHKGLEGIIKPAFHILVSEGVPVKLDIFDSSRQIYTKETIEQAMNNADVLVCASSTEGTPLPVVEAMGHGCAIVSTDVGIVSNVLPAIQKEFIVDREVDAFKSAIKILHDNRSLMSEISKANSQQYQSISVDTPNKWQNFFTDSCRKHTSLDSAERKLELLEVIARENYLHTRLSLFVPGFKNNRSLKACASFLKRDWRNN